MRYFIEVAYNGMAYSGFQIQEGQETIQSVLTRAMETVLRTKVELTGSSRTDAGVHALQNYFHWDTDMQITPKQVYNLNAVMPADMVVKAIYRVADTAHSRFDAECRAYKYILYRSKDPFMYQRGWQYPYPLAVSQLHRMAGVLMEYEDFTSFSKRNTQVHTYKCKISESYWEEGADGVLVYRVQSNRFLRGMIRGIVGTMVRIARKGNTDEEAERMFREVIERMDCTYADFTTPAYGLYLCRVQYPEGMMERI
jgi:tRNA pseudouridine38-40 synthase